MDKIAYIFAGQGSQYVGMGKDLYESFPQSKAIFDAADSALGFSLSKLCFEGPQEELTRTFNCQPAVLTVTIAAFQAYKAVTGCKVEDASFVAGLSLGEYSALVAAGVLEFTDAVKLVRKRAELMEQSAKKYPGKMAAIIGLDRGPLKEICASLIKTEIANLNSPGQIVISGEKEGVDKAKELALAKGAKRAIDLEVSGAFHSSLMHEAAMGFKDILNGGVKLNAPAVPVVANVDALVQDNVDRIKDNLVKQIYSSVLWEDSMNFIIAQGTKKFVEFGPGKVLKGLMRRINPDAEVVTIEKKEDIVK